MGYMRKTKKILQLLTLAIIVFSCGSGGLNKSKGELIGVKGKKYYPEKPFGMVYMEDSFSNAFEVYSHSYELIYSSGAY